MKNSIRKKIILTADDFGISESANKKIMELARSGKVDRISIIAGGVFSRQDIKNILDAGLKLDIHLNVTEKFSGERKLKEGITRRMALFLARYAGGKINSSNVKKEWERQIIEFREVFGKNPDGINSHQHVHYYPSYFAAVLELAEKYSISFVRFGKRGLLGKITGVKQILSSLRAINSRRFGKSSLETSDYLVSLDWIRNFSDFLKNIPQGTIEITFHPERDEEFQAINKYF